MVSRHRFFQIFIERNGGSIYSPEYFYRRIQLTITNKFDKLLSIVLTVMDGKELYLITNLVMENWMASALLLVLYQQELIVRI